MKNLITVRMIMDRMNDNPNMKSLKFSSVAAYVKDLASINNIAPMLAIKYVGYQVSENRVELPDDCLRVDKVYLCDKDEKLKLSILRDTNTQSTVFENNKLHQALFENSSFNAAFDIADIHNGNELGSYEVENGVLFIDLPDEIVKIKYFAIATDEEGFPTLPYDGSLMQAVENYVKWRYYTILSEMSIIQQGFVEQAHRQYAWYIAQYVSKVEMLTFDQAVSVANSWQRLLDTRNRNTAGKQFPQHTNI